MPRAQQGQVLVETALAAVSLIAFAFLVGRIGPWLNASMVARNDSFQGSRVLAGSSEPGRGFSAGGDIHLIGPMAERTPGVGSQPLGPSAATPVCSAGIGLLGTALTNRLRALAWWMEGVGMVTTDPDVSRFKVFTLHAEAKALVEMANRAWADALNLERNIIPPIKDDYEARLKVIHADSLVKLIGGINRLEQELGVFDARLGVIDTLLNRDLDGGGPEWRGLNRWLSDLWPDYNHCVTNVLPLPGEEDNAICRPLADLYEARRTWRDALVYERDVDWDGGGPGNMGRQAARNLLWEFLHGPNGVNAKRAQKRARLVEADEIFDRWRYFDSQLPDNLPGYYDAEIAERYGDWNSTGLLTEAVEPQEPPLQLTPYVSRLKFRVATPLYNAAKDKVTSANTLILDTLGPRTTGIRWLIADAENKEEEARKLCSSGDD